VKFFYCDWSQYIFAPFLFCRAFGTPIFCPLFVCRWQSVLFYTLDFKGCFLTAFLFFYGGGSGCF
jgi:hypothetical protein